MTAGGEREVYQQSPVPANVRGVLPPYSSEKTRAYTLGSNTECVLFRLSPVVKKKKFTGAFRYRRISYLHTHATVFRAARKHELIPYEETRAVFIQSDNQRSPVVKVSLSAFSGRLQADAHGVVPPYRQRQS